MDKRENVEYKQNLDLQHVQPSSILPHRFFVWIKHIYEKTKLKTLSKVSVSKKVVALGGGIVLERLVCIVSCTCQVRSEGSLVA